MVSKDDVQNYLDAGVAFATMTRARAEELVAELVKNGVFPGGDARAKVDELIERSRKSSEQVVAQVRSEVTKQLGVLGIASLEDLVREAVTVIGRSTGLGRPASDGATSTHATTTDGPAMIDAELPGPAGTRSETAERPGKKSGKKASTNGRSPETSHSGGTDTPGPGGSD